MLHIAIFHKLVLLDSLDIAVFVHPHNISQRVQSLHKTEMTKLLFNLAGRRLLAGPFLHFSSSILIDHLGFLHGLFFLINNLDLAISRRLFLQRAAIMIEILALQTFVYLFFSRVALALTVFESFIVFAVAHYLLFEGCL